MGSKVKKGDKVVFRKVGWNHERQGTVIYTNKEDETVVVKRLFKLYIINCLFDYIVVYKRKKK